MQKSRAEAQPVAVADAPTTPAATTDKPKKKAVRKAKQADAISADDKAVLDLWNEICTDFSPVKVVSADRHEKIRLRVAEMGGQEAALTLLRTIFTKMQESDFCRGLSHSEGGRKWKASFDWVFINSNNWVKVYEGNYDNRDESDRPKRKSINDRWL